MKKDHRKNKLVAVVLLFPFALAALGNANGGKTPALRIVGNGC